MVCLEEGVTLVTYLSAFILGLVGAGQWLYHFFSQRSVVLVITPLYGCWLLLGVVKRVLPPSGGTEDLPICSTLNVSLDEPVVRPWEWLKLEDLYYIVYMRFGINLAEFNKQST